MKTLQEEIQDAIFPLIERGIDVEEITLSDNQFERLRFDMGVSGNVSEIKVITAGSLFSILCRKPKTSEELG